MSEHTPARCIRPQCPPDCSGCNHAIPADDEALVLIADMLDHFAVDGHGGTFEDGESAMTDRARAFLCRPRAAAPKPKVERDDADRLLLREMFALCEATEDECADTDDNFKRGRAFEAKRIRRGVGTWYQDTFCGRTFMGEPAA